MRLVKQYFILLLVLWAVPSCKKAPVPTAPPNSQLSANANNTILVFTGSAGETSANQFLITGTTGTGTKLQISFSASGPGAVKLGTPTYGGQATFTSASGEVWSTDVSDTGFIYINTFNTATNNFSGTFFFNGNETKPTPNASILNVTSGSFNLTW